jgi:hypothetical protein
MATEDPVGYRSRDVKFHLAILLATSLVRGAIVPASGVV